MLIGALGRHGFRFALHGVGGGEKSLAYLKEMPLDHLSIGADLCGSLESEPLDLMVVKTLNETAHHLGICSRAMGVDSGQTFKLLQTLGVDYAQGSYLAASASPTANDPAAVAVPVPEETLVKVRALQVC